MAEEIIRNIKRGIVSVNRTRKEDIQAEVINQTAIDVIAIAKAFMGEDK